MNTKFIEGMRLFLMQDFLIMKRFEPIFRFIGMKLIFWQAISLISSISLGFIELVIALFIQALLVGLGLITQDFYIFNYKIPVFSLNSIILVLFAIGLVRFICQVLSLQGANYAYEYTNAKLKCLSIHDVLFNTSKNFIGSSEINFKISEIIPRTAYFSQFLSAFFSNLIQCTVIFLIMIITSWKHALLSTFGIIIIGLLILYINKKIRIIASNVPKEQRKINQGIEKIVRNIIFLKLKNKDHIEEKYLFKKSINYSNFAIRSSLLSNLSSAIAPFLGVVLIILIVLISQKIWNSNGFLLISFLYLMIRFIQNLSALSANFSGMNVYYPQAKMSFQYLLNAPKSNLDLVKLSSNNINYFGDFNSSSSKKIMDSSEGFESALNHKVLSAEAPEIFVSKIKFKYLNANDYIFNDFNLNIKNGEHIAIVGKSGTGKSTLLSLLIGLQEPTSGSVSIDGLKPKDYIVKYSSFISYVGPEPFLIKGSIRENLLYCTSKIFSDSELMLALESVKLLPLIEKYSLDYKIDEDLSGLSAGQKQRLCLARALLGNPRLLILDEATANLDEQTEIEISKTISDLKGICTTIIVSHRKNIINHVDKTIYLE